MNNFTNEYGGTLSFDDTVCLFQASDDSLPDIPEYYDDDDNSYDDNLNEFYDLD